MIPACQQKKSISVLYLVAVRDEIKNRGRDEKQWREKEEEDKAMA